MHMPNYKVDYAP